MRLSELLEDSEIRYDPAGTDPEVTGISTDSRRIAEGDLFVAIRGHLLDGHEYIGEAVGRGACAVVSEKEAEVSVPLIVVDDSSLAEAVLARKFYDDPASDMFLVGITGTNGKTSTAFLLRSILEMVHPAVGIIGTVGFGATEKITEAGNTTPASSGLYRILGGFREEGCSAAVMEVSSHATVQGRIAGLEFDVGVFTNITRDHLDYHGTLDEYIGAKELLASTLTACGRRKKDGTLVFNLDDRNVAGIGERFIGNKVSFGFDPGADLGGRGLNADLDGTRFELTAGGQETPIELKLLGSFSAYNALAAAAAAWVAGAGIEHIKEGLERVAGIPGRFQVIRPSVGPVVVIDYAHTPDALKSLLDFCRQLGPSRLITVFGCGGDRDRGKRPVMGRIAVDLSDTVFVTNDNPRTEDPLSIIEEILAGTEDAAPAPEVLPERSEAISAAISVASDGDLVVIAGKGHEDYQIIGSEKLHFSDMEEAEKALNRMEEGHQG